MTDIPLQIGRRFVVGLRGTELSPDERHFLNRLRPGGIILRGPNVSQQASYEEWRKILAALIQSAQEATGRQDLLVAIDHEGGRVHRLPAPITHFPPALQWSKQPFAVAQAMGKELRSLGFNVIFGPVADIHSNPANPVIGSRAFGTTPDAVSAAAGDAVRGILAAGLIPVPKHFPGHGDTHQDSHEELPVVDSPLSTLRDRELKPFAALCQQSVPCIMTAHIRFPQIDRSYPATLSETILRDILRGELQFRGIIISDDCDMKAITTRFSDELVAERLVRAGVQLGLFNHDQERALRIASFMTKCLSDNAALRKQFDSDGQSLELFFRDTLPTSQFYSLNPELLRAHAELRTSLS